MKIKGEIVLEETAGRKGRDVKLLPHDYFLALEITQVGEKPITSFGSFYAATWFRAPITKLKNQEISEIFSHATFPPDTKDKAYIALGNFPDFRKDRSVSCDLDETVLEAARKLVGTEVEFEIAENDYELVIATADQALIDQVSKNDGLFQFSHGNAALKTAPTLGPGRDAVFTIKPSDAAQQKLASYSKQVFGEKFELWNAKKEAVPYHATIAETDQMVKRLKSAIEMKLRDASIFAASKAIEETKIEVKTPSSAPNL